MWKEFREFAMRGNVIDMAVGIIIGASFGTIVNSLVNDLIMPPIGIILGSVDFRDFFVVIKGGTGENFHSIEEAKSAGAVTWNYGQFITNIMTFVIVAFAVFLLVKTINKLKRKEEAIPASTPTTKDCPFCLTKISIKASRCPQCTSQLQAETPPASELTF
jgi:large conductance mechanosensitive channel